MDKVNTIYFSRIWWNLVQEGGERERLFTIKGDKIDDYFDMFVIDPSLFYP